MARKMHAVRQVGEIRQFDEASGETFEAGSLVLLSGAQEVTEAGADPASILGWVLHDAGDHPEDGKCLVVLADGKDGVGQCWMSGDDDPVASDVDQEYGVAVDGDGVWYVDGTDTTNTRVYVVDVDLDKNMYLVRILEANRQIAA